MSGNVKIKQLLCAVLCVLIFTPLLASCSDLKTTVSVGNARVEDPVFIYYLNKAYDELGGADKNAVILRATELTRYYVKINTISAENGMYLTSSQKAELSQNVNDYWSIYGGYLSEIGVTKQAITKIYTSEAYESTFLNFFYGEYGTEKPSDEELLACFNENYLVFRSVNGYFTKTAYGGETVELTQPEKDLMISQYSDAADEVDAGTLTLSAAATRLTGAPSAQEPERMVMRKDSTEYPDGFFKEVSATEAGKAVVVASSDYVFLVVREDVTVNSEVFAEKYDIILQQLKGAELESRLASAKIVAANLNESRAGSYFKTIADSRKGV